MLLKSLSQKLARKRLNTKTTGSYADLVALRKTQSTSEGLLYQSSGSVEPTAEATPQAALFSAASYQALEPHADQHILQADSKHLFTAVLTSKTTSRGGHYLRQHLHTEFLHQIRQHSGDVPRALQESLAVLNKAFRNLHPFNPDVLEGVSIAVAYADFGCCKLHLASSGTCRCVVGRTQKSNNTVELVADVSRSQPVEAPKAAFLQVTTVDLASKFDTIIIGSAGFWQEVAPAKALLRMEHYFTYAPKANQGSAAAHLVNYALHCVTRRVRGSKDPRMRSLRSVGNLQSLHTGDKSQYKWGDRQPVRRRRGDVHRDFTAVVFRLDWEGKQGSFKEAAKKAWQTLSDGAPPKSPQASHWDLVRLHFLKFARRSRQHTDQQWHELVAQVVEHSKGESVAIKSGKERQNSVEISARADGEKGSGGALKEEETAKRIK